MAVHTDESILAAIRAGHPTPKSIACHIYGTIPTKKGPTCRDGGAAVKIANRLFYLAKEGRVQKVERGVYGLPTAESVPA